MTSLWLSQQPSEVLAKKPYYVGLKLDRAPDEEYRSYFFADPAVAPFMYAQNADELVGSSEQRRRIISLLAPDQRKLVVSHYPSRGFVFHKTIYLAEEGLKIYSFRSLKNAADPLLREMYEVSERLVALADRIVVLDYTTAQGGRVLAPFQPSNHGVWQRETGEVIDISNVRGEALQKPVHQIVCERARHFSSYLRGVVTGNHI